MENSILKLEASAGSGKTYCLALEYLSRLLLAFAGKGKKTIDSKTGTGAPWLDPGHHLHHQGGPGNEGPHCGKA